MTLPARVRARKHKIGAGAAIVALLAAGPWVTRTASAQPSAGLAPLTSSQAAALAVNVTSRVIVVLKDQVPEYSSSAASVHARSQVEAGYQEPILRDLHLTKAEDVHRYTLINALSATVSPGEEARLSADPEVAEVVPDQLIRLSPSLDPTSATGSRTGAGRTPIAGVCPAPGAAPLLEPQALQAISAASADPTAQTARSLGIDGSGVKVAFIADGLDIDNADFVRANGQHVFVDYKDFSGEGTAVPTGGDEAFLDASSIGAQGREVYNISNFSALPLNRPCDIRIEGVAPGASLVGLDVFGAEDAGFGSSILQAIDYAVAVDHVNVLNESFGGNLYPDDTANLDLIKAANDAAVAAGTTVTASTGDAGITNTIATPASDPKVISTGASTTYQWPAQVGYGGFQFPGITGYVNNNISALSSSGFNRNGSTLSLVAPGELNWAVCSTDVAEYSECHDLAGDPSPVEESGGTSEAAPLTAGAAALVIEAYGRTHHGARPSPALVKEILTSTADNIQAPADEQGSGLLDTYRAVLAAESYQVRAPAHTPATLLEATSQFNAVAAAGTKETFTEALTNVGATAEKVHLSSRQLNSYTRTKTTTVTLSDQTSPHSVDYQGIVDNYEVVHFKVAAGVARLNGSIAFKGASSDLTARVRMSLVDPDGRLSDYSVPQGVGDYGDAQVANPPAGLWTAYIWSRDSADGGTTGPVVFGASTAVYEHFGSVTPSTLTIAPRSTAKVTLAVSASTTPGDADGALIVNSPSQPSLAIPVTLRTLVPTGRTTFPGVLTGGNGRASFVGVTDYYQVNVPAGKPALNVSVKLANNKNNQTYAWLVDPHGQAQAFQSNGIVTQDNSGNLTYKNVLGTNLHVIDPAAGRWTLIISFSPTVSGTALDEPFTVSMNEAAAAVTATGLPHGATLSLDHPAVIQVRVTNTGTSPEAYFIDGRIRTEVHYNLPSITSSGASVPLSVNENVPIYLVPSATTALVAKATTSGSDPIQFDLRALSGDPDVSSGQGRTVTRQLMGRPVTAGAWVIAPDVVGPFGPAPSATEAVNTTLTATTQAFDPAVATYSGDLWRVALGGPFDVSPIVVAPGQSADIPVIIAPTATKKATISGILYLDDDSLVSPSVSGGLVPNADTIAAFRYSYKVAG
jgi:hypothetical protein